MASPALLFIDLVKSPLDTDVISMPLLILGPVERLTTPLALTALDL